MRGILAKAPLRDYASGHRGHFARFAGDSFYAGFQMAVTTLTEFLLITLLMRSLGLDGYGRVALVVALVTLIGQFFDVRVTTATTTLAIRALRRDPRTTAGVFQLSYAIDAASGVLGFLVVVTLSPLLGPHIVGGSDGGLLMSLYAVVLLASTVDDTSITVMRVVDRFKLAGTTGALVEPLRIVLVFLALTASTTIEAVFLALLAHSLIRASVYVLVARYAFAQATLGVGLFRPSMGRAKRERRELFSMLVHTNIASYGRLAMTQLPTVLLGTIAGASQVGVYKIGMAVGAGVGRLADPAMSAILPRVATLWAAHRIDEVRKLLYDGTRVAAGILGVAVLGVMFLREEIIEFISGGSIPSGAIVVLVLATLGYALNGIVFWNGQLLFATGRARAVAGMWLAGATVQVALVALLAPTSGAIGAAVAFLVTQVIVNCGLTLAGIRVLQEASWQ